MNRCDIDGKPSTTTITGRAAVCDVASGAGPSRRGSANCAFDERTGKLLLVGGVATSNGASPLSDVYSFDPVEKAWTLLQPPATPGALTNAVATYSPRLGGLFLFSGRTGTALTAQSWSLKVNAPPVVALGPSTAAPQTTVTLDASGSKDADSDPLTFAWKQVVGPDAALNNAKTSVASVVVPSGSQPLTFAVTVTDGLDSRTATLSVNALGNPGNGGSTPGADDASRPDPLTDPSLPAATYKVGVDCSTGAGPAWASLAVLSLVLLVRGRQRSPLRSPLFRRNPSHP
ncbi:MAG: PKD domain-containing protein [Myxococcaceae bacterium]